MYGGKNCFEMKEEASKETNSTDSNLLKINSRVSIPVELKAREVNHPLARESGDRWKYKKSNTTIYVKRNFTIGQSFFNKLTKF